MTSVYIKVENGRKKTQNISCCFMQTPHSQCHYTTQGYLYPSLPLCVFSIYSEGTLYAGSPHYIPLMVAGLLLMSRGRDHLEIIRLRIALSGSLTTTIRTVYRHIRVVRRSILICMLKLANLSVSYQEMTYLCCKNTMTFLFNFWRT